MKKVFALSLLLLLSFVSSSFAKTIYVATAAAGLADGTSVANAIGYGTGSGMTTAQAAAVAGDTIYLIPGAYTATSSVSITVSGSLGTAVPVVFNKSTDTFTATAHGLVDGDSIVITTTGTMPTTSNDAGPVSVAGTLSSERQYVVRDAADDSFKICRFYGDVALNITSDGTGDFSFQKISFITISGGPDRAGSSVLTGTREIPEQGGGNMDTGNTLFTLASNASYLKFENLTLNRIQFCFSARSYYNHFIYIKDVLVNHTRSAITILGSPLGWGGGRFTCPNGSHGWIVDNMDVDYLTKNAMRIEGGFHESTIANCDGDARYLFGDSVSAFHYGQYTGGISRSSRYTSGTGTAPVAGATVTGSTSHATLVVKGMLPNLILGGNVAGTINSASSTGTFQVGETITSGGWSATMSSIPADTSTIVYNIDTVNCTVRRGGYVAGTDYDQGDAFPCEAWTNGLVFERCKAFDMFDSGFDIKGGRHYLIKCVSMRSGNRTYKLWSDDEMIGCIGGYTRAGDMTQYTDGGAVALVWTPGYINIKNCTFINDRYKLHGDTGYPSYSLAYGSGTGSAPQGNTFITGQTTGATAKIAYVIDGNATSGHVAIWGKYLTFQIGEVVTDGSGFSATISTDGTLAVDPRIDVTKSIFANNATYAAYTWTTMTSGTLTLNDTDNKKFVDGVSGDDPQFGDINDRNWDVKGARMGSIYAGVDYINDDVDGSMKSNSFNSALYAGDYGYDEDVDESSISLDGIYVG
jgi:hypothetical protein